MASHSKTKKKKNVAVIYVSPRILLVISIPCRQRLSACSITCRVCSQPQVRLWVCIGSSVAGWGWLLQNLYGALIHTLMQISCCASFSWPSIFQDLPSPPSSFCWWNKDRILVQIWAHPAWFVWHLEDFLLTFLFIYPWIKTFYSHDCIDDFAKTWGC